MDRESKEQPIPSVPDAVISRRGLLRVVGKVAAVTAAIGLTQVFGSPEAAAQQENDPADALKAEIEAQFNIQITTLREVFAEAGKVYPEQFGYYNRVPRKWDIDRLNLLRECLQQLPSHFYAPDQNGNKLRYVLSYIDGRSADLNDPDLMLHQIELAHNDFSRGSYKESLDILTHETTHLLTPSKRWRENIQTAHGIFPTIREESPWFDQMFEIFGRDFFNGHGGPKFRELTGKREFLVAKVRTGEFTDEDVERIYFLDNLLYGLSNNQNPNEIMAVMGASFLRGQQYFMSGYQEAFSEDQVAQAYNFIKSTVYQGQEYDSYPLPSYRNPSDFPDLVEIIGRR